MSFDALPIPLRVGRQLQRIQNVGQPPLPLRQVNLDHVVQLSQSDGAQVKWPGIAFRKRIAAVHQAVIVDAMTHPKHVPDFVGQHHAPPPGDLLSGFFGNSFSKKPGIKTGKAEHSDALGIAGLPKHKIPRPVRSARTWMLPTGEVPVRSKHYSARIPVARKHVLPTLLDAFRPKLPDALIRL